MVGQFPQHPSRLLSQSYQESSLQNKIMKEQRTGLASNFEIVKGKDLAPSEFNP
jgi:hypothetical protein